MLFQIEYNIMVKDDVEVGVEYVDYREDVYIMAESMAKAIAAFEKNEPTAEISAVYVLRNFLVV